MTAGLLESLPRQTLSVLRHEVTIREHDRDALRPGLVEVRRDSEPRSWLRCWCAPRVHCEGPGDPRLVDVFVPAIGGCRQHRHLLPPQDSLARELAPLLLSCAVRVEGEDQLPHLPGPVPTPALHAKERHHAGHPSSEQRQGIKGALAYPQWPGTCLQRGGIEIPLDAREMIMALRLGDLLSRSHRTAIE